MLWQRREKAVEKPETGDKAKKNIFLRFLKYFCLLLLLVIIAVTGGAYWVLQTSNGQAWLVRTANTVLDKGDGLRFRLTGLSGSLPFKFSLGLESLDSHGQWLAAPEIDFDWNWRALPGFVEIDALRARNVDISRFPDIPPGPEPPAPEKNMTMHDVLAMLKEAASLLGKPPSWLPDVQVKEFSVENLVLPTGLIDKNSDSRLRLDAGLALGLISGVADLRVHLDAKDFRDAFVKLPGLDFKSAQVNLDGAIRPASGTTGLDADFLVNAGLDGTVLAVTDLPADFIGSGQHLGLGMKAAVLFPENDCNLRIKLSGPNLDAGHVQVSGDGSWQSGPGLKKDEIDGPMAFNLALNVAPVPRDEAHPDAPLNFLRSPLALNIKLDGALPKINARIDLACAELERGAYAIRDTDLSVSANDLEIPVNAAALKAMEKENHLHVTFKSRVDKYPLSLDTDVFLQALPAQAASGSLYQQAVADGREEEKAIGENSGNAGWRVGLRALTLDALGVKGSGDVAALLATGEKPALDGALDLSVLDWQEISAFLPGQRLEGRAALGLRLISGQDNAPEAPLNPARPFYPARSGAGQNVRFAVEIPSFSMLSSATDQGLVLRNLELKGGLANVFETPVLDCALDLASLAVQGMRFGAQIKAGGPLAGPLSAELRSSGDVTSRIAARWEPGRVVLQMLDLRANLARLTGREGRGGMLGLSSRQSSEITYGDDGMHVRGLDVRIIPSGRLFASGGLGKDRLDFGLKLENLDFNPWQALVPQIPAGSANLGVTLAGTPAHPGGQFNVAVKNVTLPDSPLPPISLALRGGVEHLGGASALTARLELDPKTLRALGGEQAAINARVPLSFGADGIPKLNMNGPLAARVRWNGALGPLWNLVPVADMRLNGRLDINLDAGGTLQKPVVTGGVNVAKARYENLLLGILLTDINVRLALSEHGRLPALEKSKQDGLPGGMTLQAGISDGRGGRIRIDGKCSLDGKNLDINATIDKLRPLRRRDIHVELSGKAAVKGSATAPIVNGEIVVDKGEVLLDNLELGSSVTTLNITELSPKKAQVRVAPAQVKAVSKSASTNAQANAEAAAGSTDNAPASGGGSLNVRVSMLPRFSVDGRGLSSLWKANLLIMGNPTAPAITGKIEAVKGNFDFLGKIFALTRGIVTFAGGSLANPLLDMELTNEAPDLTAHILVTGPVDKIKLAMTSDPALPRDEILSRVLFGRSVNDLSRLEALQLAAAVAQLAGFGSSGSGILGFAKKTIGVDVLRLGTSRTGAAGEPGDQTAGGTTIEMGKYINDMIYMGVQQGMHPDSTAFVIELELTPRTSLEVLTEQNRTWGGMKWKMNY